MFGVEELQSAGCGAPSGRTGISEVVAPLGALLGGDHDHTVGAACAIDGCSADVLQHLDTLDVRGVEEGQRIERGIRTRSARASGLGIVVDDETVDHIERLIAARDGIASANADVARGARLTRRGGDVQTRHGSRQGVLYRGGRLLEQVLVHGRDGAGQLAALLRAVAHHDHLLQHVHRLIERDDDRLRGVVDVHLQLSVAHEADLDNGWKVAHCDGEIPIQIRQDSRMLVHNGDGGPNDWLVRLRVQHASLQLSLCPSLTHDE